MLRSKFLKSFVNICSPYRKRTALGLALKLGSHFDVESLKTIQRCKTQVDRNEVLLKILPLRSVVRLQLIYLGQVFVAKVLNLGGDSTELPVEVKVK